ncbi:hypothetical protein FACS189434_11160 [Bacteroidia bacterium]|nr:hypothetical protein FACS189434_11160 [Bacteroidia bacterium]
MKTTIKIYLSLAIALLVCSLPAKAQTPGGISTANITPILWLTPDSYNNGTWTNLITGTGTVGNFTQPSGWSNRNPPVKAAGNNFHYAAQFRPTGQEVAANRLQSANGIGITANDAFTIIVVYKATNAGWPRQHILNFGGGSTYEGEYSLLYRANNDNTLTLGWPTTNYRNLGAVPFGMQQLVTVDVSNSNSGTSEKIRAYLNGAVNSSLSLGSINGNVNNRIVLGGAYWDLTYDSARGFNGDIQEIIILKRNRTSYSFLADVNAEAELRKLHSYLAIKYGISLSTDYYASDGTTKVWDRTVAGGSAAGNYNNNIFGIGRDDASGLYQKQSQSAGNAAFSVFVGNSLAVLNSQNTSGTLNNKQYAMFGSNGGSLNQVVNFLTGNEIPVPGSSSVINYRVGLVYKVQLTQGTSSLPSMKVKLGIPQGAPLPQYMLISTLSAFPAATTQVIPIKSSVIEVDMPNGGYITFGGYIEGIDAMPGNVTSSQLKLWLRADNVVSIASQNETSGDGKLANYPGEYPPSAYLKPDATGKLNTVRSWTDTQRNITYSVRTSGTNNDRQRAPIYRPNPLEMNYHPAVQFWGVSGSSGTNGYGSYLSNGGGWFGSNAPTNNNEHTALFVVNNYTPFPGESDSPAPRSYYLVFGNDYPMTGNTAYYAPTYGIRENGALDYPIFNTSANNQKDASSEGLEYKKGSTSVIAYRTNGSSGANNGRITFGVNGKKSSEIPLDFGTFRYNQGSTIGVGYNFNRQLNGLMSEVILFNEKLSNDNLELVEAYLGAKYGITLYGKNAGTNFDYKMSHDPNTPSGAPYAYWRGQSDAVYGRFHHNVAAIIRDDGSALHNRQSHSTDAGSMLHIGVGGVPGAKLDIDGASTLGEFENDNEVVAWGHNVHTGTTAADYFEKIPLDGCNRFEQLFKRRWLVHKKTLGDRPIKVLVGLQNNSTNNLGASADAETAALYATLKPGNEVFMIVAKTEKDIDSLIQNDDGRFISAVIPMTYINGEFQCSYTFTDETYYITFGVKGNVNACVGDKEFKGTKTLNWNQYNYLSRSNPNINRANGTNKDFGLVNFDLGDAITGTTRIQADGNIQIDRYYPRYVTSPKGIELRRNRGSAISKVTVTIQFAADILVTPSFRIYDIDENSNRYDRITVRGGCEAGVNTIKPKFSAVSGRPSYKFEPDGFTVTANTRGNQSATGKDASVDVTFAEGVNRIIIEYYITGQTPNTTNRSTYISPISLTSVKTPPPPPVINEDGISFVKSVKEPEITTCEPVEYSFYITNNNYGYKWVNFADSLPEGLKWESESLVIDSIGFAQTYREWKYGYNANSTKPNAYAGQDKLRIDSLYIPCNSTLKVSAVAQIDENYANSVILPAVSKKIANIAKIDYDAEVQPGLYEQHFLKSADRETADSLTIFEAEYQQRQDTVLVNGTASAKYAANTEVTVQLKVTNNNAPIDEMFLNVDFDAGFTYVSGSYSSTPNIPESRVYRNPELSAASNDSLLIIAGINNDPLDDPNDSENLSINAGFGKNDGRHGFTLPTGDTEFTFKLLAPAVAAEALNVLYEFVTNKSDDPCLLESINEMDGVLKVSYLGITHILTNKRVTVKIKR